MPLKHLECDHTLQNKKDHEKTKINSHESSCKHGKGYRILEKQVDKMRTTRGSGGLRNICTLFHKTLKDPNL